MNILLIEDDLVDIKAVKRSFQKHHIDDNLFIAGDGVEAFNLLAGEDREPIDEPVLILLDLQMPRMDGIEFLTKLREHPDPRLNGLPVLVLTHSNLDEDRKRINRLGVAGYFIKKRDLELFTKTVAWFCQHFPGLN